MSQPNSMAGWIWVVTAPVLLLPWVLVKFMFWIILWVLILTWRTVLSLWALRFVPLIFILVWAVGVPLQESQKTFLDIGHTVTECTDFLWNSGLRFILEDLIWCLRGLCDIFNLIAETFVITFRLVFDALESLINGIFKRKRAERMAREAAAANKRFVFDGLPDPDLPAPHFKFIEDVCKVINDIIDILKDVLIVVIGTVGNFVFQIIDGTIDDDNDVFKLIGELLNFLLTDVLGIPCLDFADGFDGFVEGLEECLAGPLGDLADVGDCASDFNTYGEFQTCVDGAKKKRRFSTRATAEIIEELGPKKNLTLAQRWEKLSDWVGKTWLDSEVLPFSGGKETRGVGGESPPIYRTPDPRRTTYGQRLWISFATVIRNKIIVFSTTHFDKETFRVVSMPYREKLRALRMMKTDLAVRDFFVSFGDYTRERSVALGAAGAPITANLHTMTTAIVTRLLAPHRLNATLEQFKTRSPQYASAVKRVALRMAMLDNIKLTRTQEILAGRLRASTVYKYVPHDYSPVGSFSLLTPQQEGRKNVLRGTIWDITNVLEYAGYADPESYLRQEMDDLMLQWKRDNNVTVWIQKQNRDKQKDMAQGRYPYLYHGAAGGTGDDDDLGIVSDQHRAVARNLMRNMNPTTTGLGMPQVRFPVVAIAKVFLKNPKFILAGIVPFLSSKPGQVVISRYLQLMQPIFGKYFSKGLTDLDANDILDFALAFTEVTIENFFYLVNVILQFLGCAIWAMILKVGSMILGFIPYVGFIFKMIGNWAVTGGALMIGNCPPDPLLDDNNVPLQTPMQYVNDILRCWETSVECTSSADCAGNAPCRVPNTALQWHTFFFTLGPQTSTFKPNDIGFCLCWPRFPCGADTPFMGSFENFPTWTSGFDISDFANETYGDDTPTLPTFAFSDLFDVDCAEQYGYEIKRIVWYKESNLFKMAWYNIRNAWLGSRYVFRDWIFSFPKQSATLFTLLLIIPLMLMLLGNMRAAVIITFIIIAIVFGMPQFSNLIEDHVVPFLERTKNSVFFLTPIWTLMLDWMRFPNHSPINVLGTAGRGEGTCAVLNSPAIIGGIGLAVTGGIILWYFFFISIFLGILFFIFAVLSAPFRILWNIGACYVFYTDAYDVSLSRRQGFYVEGHFPGGDYQNLSNFQAVSGKYIVETPHHVSRRRHRRPNANNDPTHAGNNNKTSFMSRVQKEINPPTFTDVWKSVFEPLLRNPRSQPHVVLHSTSRNYEIPVTTTTNLQQQESEDKEM